MTSVLHRLRLLILGCVVVVQPASSMPSGATHSAQGSGDHFRYEPRPGRHFGRINPEDLETFSFASTAQNEGSPVVLPFKMSPTRSSFLARWPATAGAIGYRLDVSESRAFASFVPGYHHLDVGKVTNRIVTHLSPATTYYYRVRPYFAIGAGADSLTMTSTTAALDSGLVINPTFDSSITNNADADAIESMINRAIAIYQSRFSDPITIEIYFRYANTQADGTPLPPGAAAQSEYVVYYVPWTTFINSLKADGKTTNDASATPDLPGLPLTTSLVPSSANGRAVGLNTPPALFANGTVGEGGPYDGIVTLNSDDPYKFVRPAAAGFFDAQTAVEHEVDEVIGLGSYLGGSPEDTDFRPEDLFSWSAPGTRSHSAAGTRYFSIDNGVTNVVNFSQDPIGDFGDWFSEPCPQVHFRVQNAFGCMGQAADISATSPEGVALDVVGYDLIAALIPPTPTVLGNISTRGLVETGDQVLIGGFIITGTDPKPVIVRAIGPSLPVSGALADPKLELHDGTGASIASNDNWQSDQAIEIIATGVAPTNDNESALVATLNPGLYTTVVSGANGGTGVGLVEVYDLDATVDSKLANISTRGFVGTEDNVLIGGFIVLGDNTTSTLIRAIGPSLTALGVNNALLDPELELHDQDGALIFSNDDWKNDQESEIAATGIPPSDDAESAIVMTLTPGNYTAIVSGKSNTTGVALVEIYQLAN